MAESNLLKKNSKLSRQRIIEIIIIIVLVSGVFIIGDHLRDNLLNLLWMNSDDSIHISIANSFATDQDLEIDFLGYGVWKDYHHHLPLKFSSTMVEFPSISHEQSGKGPIFYLSLGSFYYLTDTQPGTFYENGSIFSNIVASAFIILFFFLIKREFGLKIAVFSSVLVLLLPYFAWASTRILPMMLFSTFSIAAFFFLQKKKSHYLLFGVFAGLAHLTHPFGIFLAISYPIYLLINREFKGSLITFGMWIAVLMPWFLKSYYSFQNIGTGLYIPFSSYFSQFFSFLPTKNDFVYYNEFFVASRVTNTEFLPFTTLTGALENFSWLYNMDWLILFVLIATGFAFFKIEKLRQNIKYVLPIVAFFVLSYYLAFIYVTDLFVQLIFIFVIPITLVFTLWKIRKNFFDFPQSRFSSFVMLFATVTFIGYFYTAIFYEREVPETRQLMLLLFLLVPHAIFGIEKILHTFKSKVKLSKPNLIITIMLIIIVLPFSIELAYGIEKINNFWEDNLRDFRTGLDEYQKLNHWLLENTNVNKETYISSNIASRTFLDTGLKTVQMPYPWQPGLSPVERITFLDFYDISYLIFYDIPYWNFNSFINAIKPISTGYDYKIIYNDTNSYILELIDYRESNMSEPELYLKKAKYLDAHSRFSESTIIYDEFLTFEPENTQQALFICKEFYELKKFEQLAHVCSFKDELNFAENDSEYISSLYYLAYSYEKIGKVKEAINTVKDLSLKISNNRNLNEIDPLELIAMGTFLEKYDELINSKKLLDTVLSISGNENLDQNLICSAFVVFKQYEEGIIFCSDLLKNNSRNLAALYNLGLSYENTKQQDKAIEILDKYDQLLNENPKNKHNILISKGNLVNELMNLDQYYVDMVDNMLIKADEFENDGIFDMAIKLYNELTYVEKTKLDSHIHLKNMYLKNSDYDEAFKQFDIIISNIKEHLKSNNFTGKNSKIVSQKNLINLLYEKADMHMMLNELYDASGVYVEILSYDKFVSMPWQKLAFIDETQGDYALALHEYELALQFDPENHTLLEKIEELKVLLNK